MLPEIKKHWAENDYQFPSKELIDAAIGFFKKYSDNLFSKYHIKILYPDINPCMDGSVDIECDYEGKVSLLINLKPNQDYVIAVGDTFDNYNYIKLRLALDSLNEWLKLFC